MSLKDVLDAICDLKISGSRHKQEGRRKARLCDCMKHYLLIQHYTSALWWFSGVQGNRANHSNFFTQSGSSTPMLLLACVVQTEAATLENRVLHFSSRKRRADVESALPNALRWGWDRHHDKKCSTVSFLDLLILHLETQPWIENLKIKMYLC